MTESALIVGAGPGLSASLARLLAGEGWRIALAARDTAKLAPLVAETGAIAIAADVADAGSIAALFEATDRVLGTPDLVVFNASGRYRAPIEAIEPALLEAALRISAFGGFLVAQQAAQRMLARGAGSILLTGATASVKGMPGSAPFAMGKFALRGLAQSMARELAPKGIHVAHFVIDGGISTGRAAGDVADQWLDPNAIAREYLHVHKQHRSAWTWEVELRPWVERF